MRAQLPHLREQRLFPPALRLRCAISGCEPTICKRADQLQRRGLYLQSKWLRNSARGTPPQQKRAGLQQRQRRAALLQYSRFLLRTSLHLAVVKTVEKTINTTASPAARGIREADNRRRTCSFHQLTLYCYFKSNLNQFPEGQKMSLGAVFQLLLPPQSIKRHTVVAMHSLHHKPRSSVKNGAL